MGRLRGSAGAVVLVIAALALSACGVAPPPVPGGSLPAFVLAHGREVPYQGLQAWTIASVPARTSTHLTVFATGSEEGGSACGPPMLRLHAAETATSVRVAVVDYEDRAGPNTACPAIGHLPSPQTVTLQQPIGDRSVVDASTRRTRTLLVAADYPTLKPPAPLIPLPIARQDPDGPVVQSWSDGDEPPISLATTTPTAARASGPYGDVVRRFTIHGVPAAVHRDGTGEGGQQSVIWTPNSRQVITMRLWNCGRHRWTTDQAVALARSVTNSTTEATGRLPEPVTPGTAVASWSSADGPVRHAPNMWKSSGIRVGVDCEGEGTVTVALRGTSRSFSCGTTLTHHVVKSLGAPNDTFFVDVTACAGRSHSRAPRSTGRDPNGASPLGSVSGLAQAARVGHPRPVTPAERKRELETRVYGRDPDASAVAELRELLGPDDAGPEPVQRPVRRPRRHLALGAAALAVVLLGSAAWGIGAVGGRPAVAAHATPTASTHPITVFTSSGSGTTTIVDAATGQVLTRTGPVSSCSPSALDHPTDPLCRAASAFRRAGIARAEHAAATARAAASASASPTDPR